MPSTYSTSARYVLQGTGENNNTWGVLLNQGAFQLIDDNVNGHLGFALSGSKALTTANGATDEARMAFLDVTGGTGGSIFLPTVSKGYFVRNNAAGDIALGTGDTQVARFKTGDVGPCFSDGVKTYGLMLSGLPLRDYIDSKVTGGGNLPSPVGNLGKVLVVQDAGLGPTWLPGQVGVAGLAPGAALGNLGFNPVNRAGDTVTGDFAVLGSFFMGQSHRMALLADETSHFSNLFWDGAGPNPVYTQWDWVGKTLTTVANGNIIWQMDQGGSSNFAGGLRGGNIQVAGTTFTLSRSATVSYITLEATQGVILQYDSTSGQLGLFRNGGKFFVDTIFGHGSFAGQLSAAYFVIPNSNITPAMLADNAVTTPKIADLNVTTAKIADANVTPGKLAAGAAVSNIGYVPVNRAGDSITGNLTVNGTLSTLSNLLVGSLGRYGFSSDNATYAQIVFDVTLSYYLRLDWTTGKLTYYANNTAVFSIDAGGNVRAKGTITQGTAP